jgi:hypothetical protein
VSRKLIHSRVLMVPSQGRVNSIRPLSGKV